MWFFSWRWPPKAKTCKVANCLICLLKFVTLDGILDFMHSWSVTVRIRISGCMAEFYAMYKTPFFFKQQPEQCHIPTHRFSKTRVEFSMGTHQEVLSVMRFCTNCKVKELVVFYWVPGSGLRLRWGSSSCQGSHLAWRCNMNGSVHANLLCFILPAWQDWLRCSATNCGGLVVQVAGDRGHVLSDQSCLIHDTCCLESQLLWGAPYCSVCNL
jgi:hypothetical protein